jgi:hypothetical protein
MSTPVKILYNGNDVFKGLAPTPFISMSQQFVDYGTKWNQVTNLTLNGQLVSGSTFTENNAAYAFGNAIENLVKRFNENYKKIEIFENSTKLFEGTAVVDSISVDETSWYGSIPFNINLSVYEQDFFSDYYGVTEPSENFTFTDEEGDISTLNHSVSAKGFVTQNKNAIQNAKEWVSSKTGNANKIIPILIKNDKTKSYILQSTQETVDRFNGIYSWSAEYKKNNNSESPKNAFLNYNIDLSSGIEDGFVVVKIDGTLDNNSIGVLRSEYNNLNLFNICSKIATDTFKTQLSSRPISQSVQESTGINQLTFSSTFNNDFLSEIVNDYSVNIILDSLKCITTVDFKTTISCKYGDIKTKWDKVQTFYKNNFSAFNLAVTEYAKEISNGVLKQNPLTESIQFDQFNATIQYSAQFTDKKIAFNQDILNVSSNASLKPAIKIHVPKTSAFAIREHNVQNLNAANRSILNISVTAVAKLDKEVSVAESVVISETNRIKSAYLQGGNEILEDRLISKNNNIKTVTIDETWSFEGDIIS